MSLNLPLAVNKNSKILALFAISCTFCVGIVNLLTEDKIIEQQHKKLLTTLSSVIAPARFDNNLTLDCTLVTDPLLGSNKEQTIYLARMNNVPVAAAVTTIAPNGYNGAITLLVAVNIDGSISGVRTLSHQETPGLGDKIELKKSTWITNFADKKLNDDNIERWGVIKDGGMFDQFTGATITPRAVVKAVKNTAFYVQQNKVALFTAPNACQITTQVEEAKSEAPLAVFEQSLLSSKESPELLSETSPDKTADEAVERLLPLDIEKKSTASASADNEK